MKINCTSCANKDICKYKTQVETFQNENKTLIDTPKIDCLEISIKCKYYKDIISTVKSIDDLHPFENYQICCPQCNSSQFVIATKIRLNGLLNCYCTKCNLSFDE